MASKKNKNRYADIVVLILVSLCIALIGIYQIQGAVSVLITQPEPTLTRAIRPGSSGFVPPTRESEDFVGTLIPIPTVVTLTPEVTVDPEQEDN